MGYGLNNASGLDYSRWLTIMGYNPWFGNQIADSRAGMGLMINSECNTVVYQRAALSADRVGRDEIRRAIETAEGRIRRYLGTWPSPRAIEDTYPYPQVSDLRFQRLYEIEGRGRWLSVNARESDIQGLGPLTESSASTVALVYSDQDGDGYFETATATAAVPTGTDPSEVAARFIVADCGPVTPRPQIAPRSVTVVGAVATIVLNAYDLIKPIITAGWSRTTIAPPTNIAPPAQYATSIEAYRLRCDPTGTTEATAAALLIYETRPCPWAWATCCGPTPNNPHSSDPGSTATVIARATIRDAKAGIIALGEAVYNATTGVWTSDYCDDWRCYPPDRIVLRYCAGKPLDGIRMDERWATTTARLAAAELTREICGCTAANRELYEWQFDLARSSGTSDTFAPSADLTNPLGSRRGQVDAWRQIVREQRLFGILAG